MRVLTDDGPLPAGDYGFLEHYCNDPQCDCRRVLLRVTSAEPPHTVLATINYGWEKSEFYTRRMHGDKQAGQDITAASLDPLHSQSKYAGYLLTFFQQEMITDPAYVARLARHYKLFKHDVGNRQSTETPATLTIPEILRQLQHLPDHCEFAPYETALRAAIQQRDAIVPELIAAIDRVSADPDPYLRRDNSDFLHCFAIYLLAEFRETRALDSFLRFFSLPDEQALDLTGDMVTEKGAAVLASVCGGDPAPLLKLVHDESVNEFVRDQAVSALAVQCLWGERPREIVVEDLRRLFTTLSKPGNDYVWAGLAALLCDFYVPELAPEARQAFAEDLVDVTIIGLDWLEESLAAPNEVRMEDFRERNAPINAIAECQMWHSFNEWNEDVWTWNNDQGNATEDLLADALSLPEDLSDFPAPVPYIAPPKIGRNEPCPCGSGKKYKKCCGK
jgi:hypothetical protein